MSKTNTDNINYMDQDTQLSMFYNQPDYDQYPQQTEQNLKHHQRAKWRNLSLEDHEHFFKQQFSTKTSTFKNQIFLDMCKQMNIDPRDLKPKTQDDFKFQNG